MHSASSRCAQSSCSSQIMSSKVPLHPLPLGGAHRGQHLISQVHLSHPLLTKNVPMRDAAVTMVGGLSAAGSVRCAHVCLPVCERAQAILRPPPCVIYCLDLCVAGTLRRQQRPSAWRPRPPSSSDTAASPRGAILAPPSIISITQGLSVSPPQTAHSCAPSELLSSRLSLCRRRYGIVSMPH